MTGECGGSDLLQRITVRPFGTDRALASVTLPTVRLAGLWARRDAAGKVKLTAPMIAGGGGREYPAFALQPGFAERIAEAADVVWKRATAAERGRY
ncbi:hypothetical protein [Siccirubricoccus deserti]|uniref:Uncharacterized protein n=1 Tax=Siccirubricoccus deserti TaxID=2013562 RepID=A0A9X0R3C9_9PROT|nr:hypothetical protein [Siccirubricoccus deserti]MBC4018724.1 hypothetical protein [Siccirubricoccus deserti]